jgi:hypothetical protein
LEQKFNKLDENALAGNLNFLLVNEILKSTHAVSSSLPFPLHPFAMSQSVLSAYDSPYHIRPTHGLPSYP